MNMKTIAPDAPVMTRKQKVQAKKQLFINDILTEMHKASNLDRGISRAMEFISKAIANKPQEKTFYNTCLVEAMAAVKNELAKCKC